MTLLNNRQKLIKVADRSEHGWATVSEFIEDELGDNEKQLYKADFRAGKKLREGKQKQQKAKKSSTLAGNSSAHCSSSITVFHFVWYVVGLVLVSSSASMGG